MTNQEFIESIALPNEEWRDVVGFEGLYSVSSLGRVVALPKQLPIRGGSIALRNGHLKEQRLQTKRNYTEVTIQLYKNNRQFTKRVSHLVAEAFIAIRAENQEIDHIDSNSLNNKADNLRWCNHLENVNNPNSKRKLSRAMTGKPSPRKRAVIRIDQHGNTKIYQSLTEAEKDGFRSSNICMCCLGRYKTHKGFHWKYLNE